MNTLHCHSCGTHHDLWEHPDTGACVVCGGNLVEGAERPVPLSENIREMVSEFVADNIILMPKKSKDAVEREMIIWQAKSRNTGSFSS